MLGIKVPKRMAENVRKYLAKRNLIDINYRIISNDKFIYFPIGMDARGNASLSQIMKLAFASFVERSFPGSGKGINYKDMLKNKLGNEEYSSTVKGYDQLGDIAIIEPKTDKGGRALAKALLATKKDIRTVLAKGGPVSGRYRTRRYVYIAGRKNFRALYKENGSLFEFDLKKSFFSTRLAYERNRISKLVKDGESVCVMFAGVGPFAIEIAKANKHANIVAIELNKNAYKDMMHNIKLNKVLNVVAELGDVNKVASKYERFADRIVMPLPKDAYGFLDSAAKMAKKRCIVHYYAFGNRSNAYEEHVNALRRFFVERGIKLRILFKRVVRQYSPSEIEIVVDFLITKLQ